MRMMVGTKQDMCIYSNFIFCIYVSSRCDMLGDVIYILSKFLREILVGDQNSCIYINLFSNEKVSDSSQ